jgi:hypothetical protein
MRFSPILVLCLLSLASYAQIDTDRPAFTNSVNVVPQNRLQFEGGMAYTLQATNVVPILNNGRSLKRLETYTLPQAVFRYGITSRAEVRFEVPQFSLSRYKLANDSQSRYATDLWNRQVGMGLKFQILDKDKFTLSYLATLRTERDNFPESERELTFGLFNDLIWEYRFNEKSKMAGTLGFGNGKDAYAVNAAALIGTKINNRLWLQAEAVSENYLYENSRYNVSYYTLNLSSQYALTQRDAIDLTVGSVVHSTAFILPRNLTIQLGYAHLFNAKNE